MSSGQGDDSGSVLDLSTARGRDWPSAARPTEKTTGRPARRTARVRTAAAEGTPTTGTVGRRKEPSASVGTETAERWA